MNTSTQKIQRSSKIFMRCFVIVVLFLTQICLSQHVTGITAANGIVTIAFDDGNQNQYDNAYPALRARGMNATYFVVTDWVDAAGYMTLSELMTLQDSGSEIASHSKTHIPFTYLSDSEIQTQCAMSKQALQNWGFSVTDFAYPSGMHDNRTDTIVAQYYSSARTSYDEPFTNQLPASTFLVYGVPAENGGSTFSQSKNWIDKAIASNAWIILFFHNVVPQFTTQIDPNLYYQVTVDDFIRILDYLTTKNVPVMTVSQVLQSLSARAPQSLKISVNVTLQPLDMTMQYSIVQGCNLTLPVTIQMWQREWKFSNWNDGSTDPTRTFTANANLAATYS